MLGSGPRRSVAVFGHDFHIKSVCTVFGERINRRNQAGKMKRCCGCLVRTQLAIKVQKINAHRLSAGALAFDVFADVVFGRIKQPVAIFTVNI